MNRSSQADVIKSWLLVTAVLFLWACKTQPERKPDEPAEPAKAGDAITACVDSMTRARACTDNFIPALVATRVRLDRPPGIAKADAEAGREALVEGARSEWANDSKDEAIKGRCEAIAKHAPPEMVNAVNGCMAKDSCAAYSECYVAVIEPTL